MHSRKKFLKVLIEKYLSCLTKKFIKDKKFYRSDLIFKDDLGKDEASGFPIGANTSFKAVKRNKVFLGIKWGSYWENKSTFFFLNDCLDEDIWRQRVVHEFTHFYLLWQEYEKVKDRVKISHEISHEHDDNFYSKMDYFEAWMDKELNLSPRKNKGYDWEQHINPLKRVQRREQFPISPFVWERKITKFQWI